MESAEQLLPLARFLADCGVDMLRGGAYKPRTRPSDFQGLGREGLELLARAKEETGLPVVTEVVDAESLAQAAEIADTIQIGARNMHNYALLKKAGRTGLPVLLKRGFAATVEEWLAAADYVREAGDSEVVLCERGIRTFSRHSRFTLDLSVLPVLRERTDLPVCVDPSHATGRADAIAPMARAAVAAGADAVMIEVHPDPPAALCDGAQALRPEAFATLCAELRALGAFLAGAPEEVAP